MSFTSDERTATKGTKPQASASAPASNQMPASKSWVSTPAPVRRLFHNFPLQSLPAEPLPACPHDAPSSQPLPKRSESKRSSTVDPEDTLPTLHIFADPSDARHGLPSYNPSCLQHQAWLRIHRVKTRCVASSNHAAPNGVLPFLMPARKRAPQSENPNASEHSEKHDAKRETSQASRNRVRHVDTTGARDVPISSTKIWEWAITQSAQHESYQSKSRKDSSLPHAQEAAYIALVEHRLRAAWLLALYMTPANFPLLVSLYIRPTTTSSLIHHLQAFSLVGAAREALHTLSPPTTSTRLTHVTPTRPLMLLPAIVKDSLPEALVSRSFPDQTDRRSIYAAADQALEALAVLLGNDEWYFGAASPGKLDVIVFSYVHLMIGHARVRDHWVDPWWRDLGAEKKKGRKALRQHWQRMMEACLWEP